MNDINLFKDGHKKKVLIFPFRKNTENKTEVLLGIHAKQQKRNFPGGKVGDKIKDETSVGAAIRELGEETHLKAEIDDMKKVGNMIFHFPDESIVDLYIYTVDRFKPLPEDEWDDEEEPLEGLQWYDIENLPVEEMWESDFTWLQYVFRGEYFEGRLIFGVEGNVAELYIRKGVEDNEIRVI